MAVVLSAIRVVERLSGQSWSAIKAGRPVAVGTTSR